MALAIPTFGYKSHISADRWYGFIRRWGVTDAAANDGKRLKDVIDRANTAADVWADTWRLREALFGGGWFDQKSADDEKKLRVQGAKAPWSPEKGARR